MLMLLVAVLVMASMASAATVWNPAANGITPPATGNWNDAANWTNGVPVAVAPGETKAVFNVVDAAECVVTDAQSVGQIAQGDNRVGGVIRIKDGGSLTTTISWSTIGYNDSACMIIEKGGSLVVSDLPGTRFHVGIFDSVADQNDLLILDGYMEVNALFDLGHSFDGFYDGNEVTGTPYDENLIIASAVINGTLDVDSFAIHTDNCQVDLRNGTIIIDGDQTATIEEYVADGRLVAFGGDETILIDLVTHPGRTTLTSTKPVDAGKDMITWSGEPVILDATVKDDVTVESLAWSAEPDEGVVFDPPDANVEDPTVTITKPDLTLIPVPIVNAGFEDPILGEGGWTSTPTAWTNGYYDVTAPGVWVVGDSGSGAYNPTAADGYGGVAAEGYNLMAATSSAGYDKGMNQVLSATLQANTQYELSALVGNPFLFNGSTATADYRIELLAGGVLLASDTGPSPADDTTWTVARLTYDSGGSPAQLGEALEIRLLAVNFTDWKGVDFDDVKLTAAIPAPDPYTVSLTLTVNDENQDTITIDVYDDACEAARVGNGLAADNIGDFNGNCVTDPNDLAELATKWLTGYTLSEAVTKP